MTAEVMDGIGLDVGEPRREVINQKIAAERTFWFFYEVDCHRSPVQ